MYTSNQSQMTNNYSQNMPYNYQNPNDDRLLGGFAFPFLLGGVTGAALAPNFWGPGYGYNRPYYNNYYYRPYYYPRYW